MTFYREIICQAILEMRVIEFRYKGSWRLAEPHALGLGPTAKIILCAWQLTGGSGQGWRDFHVDLINDVTVTDELFDGSRPGYNPSDKTLTTLICAIQN